MLAIETRNLSKAFGNRMAVNDISITVEPGELFGFLGPNGAGKTTTIKMLVGLLRPTTGFATLWGFDIVEKSLEARAVIGYVPDQPALYDKLTGREMLAMAADLYNVPRSVQKASMEPLLESFSLAEQGNELVQSYSRGMRQKLGLCCALIHDPKILFLDEPTVGLDPAGARQLKDVLRHLTSEGKTVFLSTHVLEVAELLCDKVAIVQKGCLTNMGTPRELRNLAGDNSLEDAFLRLTRNPENDDNESLLAALGNVS